MSYIRSYNPVLHFDDDHGHPLADGWLFTFLSGTSTPVATSANENGSAMNPVRIRLDSRGECEVWLDPSIKYKFEIWDSTRTWHKTVDNVFVTEGGSGGGGGNVRRSDLKSLTLKKGNNVFGTYNPLEQKTIDIPDSICYISEQAPNLYRAVADMLIADIMPVLMRSDTDPNVQGVTRDHYYYPAARTGVNSDYEFIGYDGDRVEVATVHQDNSVTYSVKPNGVHRLAKKYVEVDGEDVMTLGDGDRCSGAEPNGETVTKSELLAWLDAGETLIFSFYGFGNYQKRWGIAENVILGGSGSSRYVSADFYVRTVDEYLFEHYRFYTTGDSEFVTLQQYQSISNETTANKVQTLDDSGSHYPSCPAVKSYVAGAMPAASTATPAMDGVASAGSSTSWARGDHVHPTDTSREAVANKSQTLDPTSTTDYPSSAAAANFVNSSVATNTANFLGSFTLVHLGLTYPATDVQIAAALNSHTWPEGVTPTNNDYVYVEIQNPQTTGVDDKVERFKYRELLSSWGYEYTLNNSSFTAAEMAALESGIDSSKVATYDAAVGTLASHVADSTIHVTAADKTAWGAKYDKPSTGIPASDMSSAVQTSLGKADTAIQDVSDKLDKTGDASNCTVTFTAENVRSNVSTGEKLAVLFGKVAKWFSDLKALAFKDKVSDSDIEDVKDLEADESSLTMSESLSAFTLMVKTGGINLLHLNSKLQPAALQFLDANDNDLDGQDTGFTFADPVDPTEKPLIGKIPIPTPWQGWVDFTLSFEFVIQQQTIGADKTFLLHVWSGQTMTSSTILDSRTVKVKEDSPFVHERFSFDSDHVQDYVYVTFERVDSISNFLLKNVTLNGFRAFGI